MRAGCSHEECCFMICSLSLNNTNLDCNGVDVRAHQLYIDFNAPRRLKRTLLSISYINVDVYRVVGKSITV